MSKKSKILGNMMNKRRKTNEVEDKEMKVSDDVQFEKDKKQGNAEKDHDECMGINGESLDLDSEPYITVGRPIDKIT